MSQQVKACLHVTILSGKNFPFNKSKETQSYATLSYENQGVRLESVVHQGEPVWGGVTASQPSHLCKSFDITDDSSPLVIHFLNEKKGGKGEVIGRVSIQPMELQSHQSLWYPLLSKKNDKAKGEVHVLLQLDSDSHNVCIDDFDLLKVLGKGSYGKVMQVKKKDTGRIYALKVMKKQAIIDSNEVEHILSEKQILQHIQSPFIVGLKYAFQSSDRLYLCMDFIAGGELFYHLQNGGRFTEERAKFYISEILLAIDHLHQNEIIYRDLKLENVMLGLEGHVCLTDFGLCKEGVGYDGKTFSYCGTPEYLAPEVLHCVKGYGRAVDWWSLGILLYEMLVGLPPFYSRNVQEMYKKILHASLRFPAHLTNDAIDLLKGLLTRDPAERLGSGVTDAEEIKSHPFFRDIDWVKLSKKEIEPPFKPSISSEDGTDNFDASITIQDIRESFVNSGTEEEQSTRDEAFQAFQGFSIDNSPRTPSTLS